MLAFTLIDSISRAKIDARAAGAAVTADSYYVALSRNSALDAKTIAEAQKSASECAGALSGQGVAIVVHEVGHAIGCSLPDADHATLPASRGSIRINGANYEAVTRPMSGFGTAKICFTVLSDAAMTSSRACSAICRRSS